MSDTLVLEKQTPYQKIQLFKELLTDKTTLSLDGFIQLFEGEDERIYHKALTQPAFKLNPKAEDFLVLGGGDGCVAREILKLNPKAKITLVDIDKELVEFCKKDERLTRINQNSLNNCRLYYEDALIWVPRCKEKSDMIILDFPDPTTTELKKLYAEEFLSQVVKLLGPKAVISIQSGQNPILICNILYKLLHTFVLHDYQMPTLGLGYVVLAKNG